MIESEAGDDCGARGACSPIFCEDRIPAVMATGHA